LPHWISHLSAHLKQELEEMLHVPVDLVSLRDPLNPNLRQVIFLESLGAPWS
jgi:hypothetical protein